jgi:hypothetical protein
VYWSHISQFSDTSHSTSLSFGIPVPPLISRKPEPTRQKSEVCSSLLLPHITGRTYANAIQLLNIPHLAGNKTPTWHSFFVSVSFILSQPCPISHITGLRAASRKLRNFPLFHVTPFFKNCPFARGASAVNWVCSDLDVFRRQSITHICDIIIIIIIIIITTCSS